jgi:cystathionine gamma-lyase / homocysteine desulfhydrase
VNRITKALHTRVDDQHASAVVTPIYQASAFTSGSSFFYSRKNNPNVEEIELVIAAVEEARFCVGSASGMSAIAMVLDLIAKPGSLVVNRDMYGCSLKAFQKFASKSAVGLVVMDLSRDEDLQRIPADTQMVLFETPTNPFLKHIDIAAVARATRSVNPEALIVVDNTWATSLFQQPLKHGADISLHSATKYISGHSDVMGGFALTDREELHRDLSDHRFYFGAVMEPFSAWLLRRSMQTFELRMMAHAATAIRMRDFLVTRPEVDTVYYPRVDGRQLTAYGTLLFLDLHSQTPDAYQRFSTALTLFDTGTGMACVTSMVAQPFSGSHASLTAAEKRDLGIGTQLVRLSFGFEAVADLEADLNAAFDAVSRSPV